MKTGRAANSKGFMSGCQPLVGRELRMMNERPASMSASLDSSHVQRLEQLGDEEFWDYARELARQTPTSVQSEAYLECTLSRGQCLIPLTTLYELVLPPHRLALLPAAPQWMSGVVAWHGETIAVIDLDRYLSGQAADLTNGMLLIANYAGLTVGLLVQRVGQTRPIQQDIIEKNSLATQTDASTDGVATKRAEQEGGQVPVPTMPDSSLPDQSVDSRSDGPSSPREWHDPSRAAFVRGVEGEALILDMPSLLADVVQQIEIAASNG